MRRLLLLCTAPSAVFSAVEARAAAATQKPAGGSVFTAVIPGTVWRTVPSSNIGASEDQTVDPELERFCARRIGATTTEINSRHVPFLSRPEEMVESIEAATASKARAAIQ